MVLEEILGYSIVTETGKRIKAHVTNKYQDKVQEMKAHLKREQQHQQNQNQVIRHNDDNQRLFFFFKRL
jgi:hypothetical protein